MATACGDPCSRRWRRARACWRATTAAWCWSRGRRWTSSSPAAGLRPRTCRSGRWASSSRTASVRLGDRLMLEDLPTARTRRQSRGGGAGAAHRTRLRARAAGRGIDALRPRRCRAGGSGHRAVPGAGARRRMGLDAGPPGRTVRRARPGDRVGGRDRAASPRSCMPLCSRSRTGRTSRRARRRRRSESRGGLVRRGSWTPRWPRSGRRSGRDCRVSRPTSARRSLP